MSESVIAPGDRQTQKITTNAVANNNTTTALTTTRSTSLFEIYNTGATHVQVAFGGAGQVAANADSYPIPGGQRALVSRLPGDTHIAHISLTGTSIDIYVTPIESNQPHVS